MNKKGAEMTISTLVIIVLAIIVLVVLALGFGAGWTNLWSKISGYFTPVNVDTIKQACNYACTTQAKNDYCCLKRDLIVLDKDGKKDTKTYAKDNAKTCFQLENSGLGFESCDLKCVEVECLTEGVCDGTFVLAKTCSGVIPEANCTILTADCKWDANTCKNKVCTDFKGKLNCPTTKGCIWKAT